MPIISANRTITIVPPWTASLQWPIAQPDDILDYALDVTSALADVGDAIVTATVCAAPYGAGELTINSISFSGGVITVWLAGGVAGRVYFVNLVAFTTAGREFSWYVRLPISARLAEIPIPIPPYPGYSTPIST